MIYELPLFPLNTVLFPDVPLPLHIFEARYKEMIKYCVDNDEPFGVALIKDGIEAGGPLAKPRAVGCAATIHRVEQLDDGRLNILVVGRERFKIHALNHDKPYLVAEVEDYPLPNDDPETARRLGDSLRPRVAQYIQMLAQINETDFDIDQIPDDPLRVGYVAALALNLTPEKKQTILEAETAVDFLREVGVICRREIALLRAIIEREPDNRDTFPLN